METYYLGRGIEYPRSLGDGSQPPDGIAQTQAGLAAYRNPGAFNYSNGAVRDTDQDNPYNRFFEPVADFARPFLPGESIVYEQDTSTYGFSAMADVDLPFLTRSFVPDRAHVKAGPVFLDVLSIGSGLIYSDFTGAESFPAFRTDQEDGLLSYISLRTRTLARITPNVYLSLASNLIYLPQRNQLGFQAWQGGNFGPIARLNWDRRLGTWDLQAYDSFRVVTGLSYFADLQSDAWQRAGRYQFGYFDGATRTQQVFNEDAVYFTNSVGARASSLLRLLNDDWRLWLDAQHSDYWRSYDFINHGYRDQFGTMVAYDGNSLPFLPAFRYTTFSNDRFESSVHQASLQGRGRLTENVSTLASTGYAWTQGYSGRESLIWELALNHNISERASQRFSYNQGFFTNDFSNDIGQGRNLGYRYTHLLASRLSGTLSFALSDGENLNGSVQRQSETYGLSLGYNPLDYTRIQVGSMFQNAESSNDETFASNFNRWIYYANLTQQFASRSNVTASYRFEDTDLFMEHFYRLGVTRYF